jgi:hypothetical protein
MSVWKNVKFFFNVAVYTNYTVKNDCHGTARPARVDAIIHTTVFSVELRGNLTYNP